MTALFEKWIGERTPVFLGTNHMSQGLPYSSWYRFKEAFSPELVKQAIADHPTHVEVCIDPFAGSGTTGLTCQFLGIKSTSFEVNPFLVDLGRAKVERYELEEARSSFSQIMEALKSAQDPLTNSDIDWLPKTFVEPGRDDKWLFDEGVARAAFELQGVISCLLDPALERLFRVILGSSLIENSNVVINGKGRRYRKNWQGKRKTRLDLVASFQSRATQCFSDIESFGAKSATQAEIERRDVRDSSICFPEFDVCIFSPPYPNSFDYTDVYNVELWMLGYLKSRDQNAQLRKQTLTSHLQVSKPFSRLENRPQILERVLEELDARQDRLWDKRIPRMVETYFFEMSSLLERLMNSKRSGGRVWIVVGNSQYVGVEIESGKILAEIATSLGYTVLQNYVSRHLRTSPQQGGFARLGESILVLA